MENIAKIPVQELNFEQSLSELEQIIDALEASQPSLEDAIKLYERGRSLAQRCEELLNQAELQIRQITEEEPGVEE